MNIKQKIYYGPMDRVTEIIQDYDTVFIDIWSDDYNIPTKIGGKDNCNHTKMNSKGICSSCGAWIGNIGEEYFSYDYFKHIFNFVSSINKNLLISSDRYYPNDFHIEWIKEPDYFKHSYNFSVQDKVISMSTSDKRTQKVKHYNWFSNEHKSPYLNEVILYRGSLHNTLTYGKTLFVNPQFSYINYNQTIDYLVCNENIIEALKNDTSFIPRDYIDI